MKNLRSILISLWIITLIYPKVSVGQKNSLDEYNNLDKQWVDSIFATLSLEEQIAQLFILPAYSNKDSIHVEEICEAITKYKIGGICFFQANAVEQVRLTNLYQSLSKVPLMIFMDAEWGVGMRLDDVANMPFQIMLGAMNDASLVYEYAKIVGRQFKRLGMHFNFAPVLDINSNSDNPIINYRSFGEDKEQVALMGIQYIRGLEKMGILASAKHFPGHGDVDVDSHYELPVIHKTISELNDLELYPFRRAIMETNVAGIMIAHLNLPKIMDKKHLPSSISPEIIKNILREKLNFSGLVISDALNMDGFKKYIANDHANLLALKSGNDLLNLPDNLGFSIKSIKQEMLRDSSFLFEVQQKVKRVLLSKYHAGLYKKINSISSENLIYDLNEYSRSALNREIVNSAITLVRMKKKDFLDELQNNSRLILYIAIGEKSHNKLSYILRQNYNCSVEFLDLKANKKEVYRIYNMYKKHNPLVLIGMHSYGSSVKKNYNFNNATKLVLNKFSKFPYNMSLLFGNPYILKNFDKIPNILLAYNNSNETQSAVANILAGKQFPRGHLPFNTKHDLLGAGIHSLELNLGYPELHKSKHLAKIDNIMREEIAAKTFPGAVIMAIKDGRIIYQKAFGKQCYDECSNLVTPNTIYDVASLTKGFATTLAIMKLYEDKIIDIDAKLSQYLPLLKGTNKENITIKEVLWHESGLPAWLPFHKTLAKINSSPLPYSSKEYGKYNIRIAQNLYFHHSWHDSLIQSMLKMPLGEKKYRYSDIGFIFLGMLVQQVSQLSLDEYLRHYIYDKIGTEWTMFNPYNKVALSHISPTENDKVIPRAQVHGFVHDYIAALMGGVAGHAGLFSTAPDLMLIAQLLLNKGNLKNMELFKPETVEMFTQLKHLPNHRGLGFDKPELGGNRSYPSSYSSDLTFGHSGFTGTAVWIDPKYNFAFVFLSNRVYPNANNNQLRKHKVRERILDLFYQYILDK